MHRFLLILYPLGHLYFLPDEKNVNAKNVMQLESWQGHIRSSLCDSENLNDVGYIHLLMTRITHLFGIYDQLFSMFSDI